jgi:hypothetical protein
MNNINFHPQVALAVKVSSYGVISHSTLAHVPMLPCPRCPRHTLEKQGVESGNTQTVWHERTVLMTPKI